MHNENWFGLSTPTVKAEETPSFSLFLNSSVGSPVRRIPGEFTPTYFQTISVPMGNMGAVNSVNTDHQNAGQVPFGGQSLPKLKLREFSGDAMEWPERSGLFQSTVRKNSLSNDEKLSNLKTLLTGAARRSVQCLGYSESMFNAAWTTLERKFGQPHLIISAQLSRAESYPTMKHQDSKSLVEFAVILPNFVGVLQQFGCSNDIFSSSNLELVTKKFPLDMRW